MALLAAAALALGACGGDDDRAAAAPPAPARPSSPPTPAPARRRAPPTERERTGTTEDRTTSTKERTDDTGGGARRLRRRWRLEEQRLRRQGRLGQRGAARPTQPGNVDKVAKTVCNSFLPKQIERDLEDGKRKPEDVARDYSRGFPDKQAEARLRRLLGGLEEAVGTRKGGPRAALLGQPGSSMLPSSWCAVRLRHEDSLPQEGRLVAVPAARRASGAVAGAVRPRVPDVDLAELPDRAVPLAHERPGSARRASCSARRSTPIVDAAGADAGRPASRAACRPSCRSRPRRARCALSVIRSDARRKQLAGVVGALAGRAGGARAARSGRRLTSTATADVGLVGRGVDGIAGHHAEPHGGDRSAAPRRSRRASRPSGCASCARAGCRRGRRAAGRGTGRARCTRRSRAPARRCNGVAPFGRA